MSNLVYRDAYVWVNGVDLSDHVKECSLNYQSESLDDTVMGDTTRSHKGGLFDWSIDLSFLQDFASGKVDATMFSLVGTTTCVEIRPKNSCTTGINPSYSGIVTVMSYNPMSGAVGTLLPAPVKLQSASALTRSVTAS